MKELIHTSATAAWEDLKSRGGLELDGRDEGLEENLRVRLSPSAFICRRLTKRQSSGTGWRAFFRVTSLC